LLKLSNFGACGII
jgi:hypothetical protein